jgi:hypothetical protein
VPENKTPSASPPDPIALAIVECIGDGPKTPQEVAKTIAKSKSKPSDPPDLWRRYLPAVKNQMVHLARAGEIEITRQGKVVNPNDFRGLVKLRRPEGNAR